MSDDVVFTDVSIAYIFCNALLIYCPMTEKYVNILLSAFARNERKESSLYSLISYLTFMTPLFSLECVEYSVGGNSRMFISVLLCPF